MAQKEQTALSWQGYADFLEAWVVTRDKEAAVAG